jgi:hypothetical protein
LATIHLKDVSIREAYIFFLKNKNKKLEVDFRYKEGDTTLFGWTDRPKQILFGYVDDQIGNCLTVYFSTASLEVTEKEFIFSKDKRNRMLMILPKESSDFTIVVTY